MSDLTNGGGGVESPHLSVHAVVHAEHGGGKHGKLSILASCLRWRWSRLRTHTLTVYFCRMQNTNQTMALSILRSKSMVRFVAFVPLYCTCWLCVCRGYTNISMAGETRCLRVESPGYTTRGLCSCVRIR